MPKNILQFDMVNHIINMMQTQRNRTLPKVGIPCVSGVSALLIDGLASLCKAFLPEKQGIPIKLRKTYLKGL